MAVAHPGRKQERLEARLSAEDKERLEHAAALEGTTLTEFVLRSAREAAAEVISTHETLTLTVRESQAFVASLLDPPAPNAALRAAAERYYQVMGAER